MNNAAKTYILQFGVAMLLYVVLLPLSIVFMEDNLTSGWRFALAVLPVLPILLGVLAMTRFMSKMDEMHQQIQLQGLTFASVGTALLTFTYGLLENTGLPHLPVIYVLPLMVILWGIGAGWSARRYQ